MTAPIPFKPRRFESAARHYLQGRPPYAPALFVRLAGLCGLDRRHRVLDLGCGPGQIAQALAPFAGEVIAADPEPEMLRIAAESAAAAGLAIGFRQASSYDLPAGLGMFRLVTMGRAFHWMDRLDTLRRLDAMVEPDGAVALIHDSHPEVPANAWNGTYQALIDRYAAGDEDRVVRKSPRWVRHEAVLLDSAFCELEEIAVLERRRTPVGQFVDRALSLSSTAPGRIGARAESLAQDMRAAMAGFARDGLVDEVVRSHALIARRRAGGPA